LIFQDRLDTLLKMRLSEVPEQVQRQISVQERRFRDETFFYFDAAQIHGVLLDLGAAGIVGGVWSGNTG
jgi:hypothetical protein